LGAAVSEGFDLQIATRLTDNIKVNANVGYTNAYTPKTVFGGAFPDGTRAVLAYAGDKFGDHPVTAAVNAEYRGEMSHVWAGSVGYFRVDYRWLDRSPPYNPLLLGADSLFYNTLRPKAYSLLNVRWGLTKDALDVSLFVNNLTKTDPVYGILPIG